MVEANEGPCLMLSQ